jgi:hypothetical protein
VLADLRNGTVLDAVIPDATATSLPLAGLQPATGYLVNISISNGAGAARYPPLSVVTLESGSAGKFLSPSFLISLFPALLMRVFVAGWLVHSQCCGGGVGVGVGVG